MPSPIAGDYALRCRKCEGKLDKPRFAWQVRYGLEPNEHGAVVRACPECKQLWLGYMMKLPDHELKIILKMVDKEL